VTRALVVAAAILAALALPTSASAHVTLSSASPATQSTVDAPPTEIRLGFDQAVAITSRSIRVLAPNGEVLSGTTRLESKGRAVVAPVSGLRRGLAYTVRWRVAGADGHSPAGVFTFGVGVEPPPPTEAAGAAGTTWKDNVARWLLFVSFALLIGPLAMRLLVVGRPLPDRLETRFHLVTAAAALLAINAGIAAFVVRASNALQLPFADLVYGDLQPFAEKTRFGVAFLAMTVGLGAVAALLLLAWIFEWSWARWWAFGLSLFVASGLSLSGHQATEPNASLPAEVADWVHLVGACVWVGGLVTLAFLVWPAAPELRRSAFLGFSRLAVGVIGAMVLAGGYLAIARLPQLSDLWETDYGRLLLLKLAIVSLALAWGGFHHTYIRPRLEAGVVPRVRPSLIGETAIAFTVLLAAAALTNATPPPVEPDSTAAVRASR
jgi:copper transport protein